MTSAVSTDSFFGRYFFYKLRQLKPQMVFSLVFGMLGLPALMTAALLWAGNPTGAPNEFIPVLLIIGGLSMTAVLILFAALPAINYSYYNRQECVEIYDMLPLTFRQRFWADFLSGLAAGTVPFLLSLIPTVMIGIIADNTYRSSYAENLTADAPKDLFAPDFLARSAVNFIIIFVIGLLAMYVIGVFINACCGRPAVAVTYTVLAAIALPGITALIIMIMYVDCVGVDCTFYVLEFTKLLPPLGTLFVFFASSNIQIVSAVPLLVTVLIYAGILVAAYFLAKHRNQEKVGRMFVYSAAHHTVTVLLVACVFIAALYTVRAGVFFAMTAPIVIGLSALVTVVPFFLLDFSFYREFAKLWRSAIKYGICAIGSFILFNSVGYLHGFGAAEYVPQPSDISSVTVDVYGRYMLTFDNLEDIEFVTDCHQKLLSKNLSTGDEIKISYNMKNGVEINRSYNVEYLETGFADELSKYSGTMYALTGFGYAEPKMNIAVPCEGIGAVGWQDADGKLSDALRQDMDEHHDGGENIGYIGITMPEEALRPKGEGFGFWYQKERDPYPYTSYIPIKDNYENTLELLRGQKADGKCSAMSVVVEYSYPGDYGQVWSHGNINMDHAVLGDMPEFKEFISLIKVCPDGMTSYDVSHRGEGKQIGVVFINGWYTENYYIPQEDMARAVELYDKIYELVRAEYTE
ncbi:MAG: hypothetical protein J1E39_07430 [Eubacterium sp.]|nr:hypothetical protein [Eubacterium sp.]